MYNTPTKVMVYILIIYYFKKLMNLVTCGCMYNSLCGGYQVY
jgi:hypothetical protein